MDQVAPSELKHETEEGGKLRPLPPPKKKKTKTLLAEKPYKQENDTTNAYILDHSWGFPGY